MINRSYLVVFLILIGCSDDVTSPKLFESMNVDIRMEVQILDSTYQLYSRSFTDIYFTTYKLNKDNSRIEFTQSDTTSCPNGWGVKLLNFTFDNRDEKIILGAACEDYFGINYREISIDYDEAERRIDSTGHASIIKTFAIYYK